MLVANGADIDARTNDGWTPLHVAANEGREEPVQFLLENKADINAKTSRGWTPLHLALKRNKKQIVQMYKGYVAEMLRKHGGRE
jgi:ankyrin repeat protein